MDRTALVQVFDQVIGGWDIPTPAGLLRLASGDRSRMPEGSPYSVITNLAHAVLWQDFWLRKLAGGKKKSGPPEWNQDFRVPAPDEWDALRRSFVAGLEEARRIAASEPFDHRCADDAEAVETLVRIAVHGTYHLGQLNLLKRLVRASRDET